MALRNEDSILEQIRAKILYTLYIFLFNIYFLYILAKMRLQLNSQYLESKFDLTLYST